MNHLCYKTIFSKHLGALVAVGEHACSQSKGQGASGGTRAATGLVDARFVGMLALGFATVSLAWSQTLPQGPQVAQGAVSFSQSARQMDITQSTAKAVVNWQSFDIGQNAKVNITQPSSQSVLLNRVLSDNPSRLYYQGYGGLAGVGAATGQASYSVRPNTVQACTPQKLEDCICERPSEMAMEICFPAEQGRQARR